MKNNKQIKIEVSRKLRTNATFAECMLWNSLRSRKVSKVKFRRQYVFLGFILDFFCPEFKIGIELDGEIHLKQLNYDKARAALMKEHGITIIRFKNREIIDKLDQCIETIEKYLTVAHKQETSKMVLPLHLMERETVGEAC